MQLRTEQSNNSLRTVKVLNDREARHKNLYATSGNQWDANSRFTKRKVVLDKRERMPRNDLLNLLFRLFQEQPMYNLKALEEKTQQPTAWLKELLNETCILNKKGPNTGSYQLKPEYLGGEMQI